MVLDRVQTFAFLGGVFGFFGVPFRLLLRWTLVGVAGGSSSELELDEVDSSSSFSCTSSVVVFFAGFC